MLLQAPEAAGRAGPGQFVHVRCGFSADPLLRRPLSVHDVDRGEGTLTLLYRVAGRGTALLAGLEPGAGISLMGPLGRGFSLPEADLRVALVAGGIGVAPLYFLLKELVSRNFFVHVLVGAQTAEDLLLEDDFQSFGGRASFATDDGSRGYKGRVTGLLEPLLASGDIDLVYACGPPAMLKRVAGLLTGAGVPGEVSLERHMGCGVGACLSCVCKVRSGAYRRVCADGPVFPVEEVVWE
ncbi:MAG: dihydroorotate dehydrogenase electron transfer subunit [Peptococcaceae bacterium]|nr:MAG: dihydroorotate dehydrogenase electron transfer subunit [Peptococcaceae bacterium]